MNLFSYYFQIVYEHFCREHTENVEEELLLVKQKKRSIQIYNQHDHQ